MDMRPFKLTDMALLDLQDVDRWVLDEVDQLDDWEGSAFTVLDDGGRPIGVSGLSVEGEVGTGWLVGSKELRERPFYFHRTMKRVLRELLGDPRLLCIHVTVENWSSVTAEWLKRLGFILIARSRLTSKYMICKEPQWQ